MSPVLRVFAGAAALACLALACGGRVAERRWSFVLREPTLSAEAMRDAVTVPAEAALRAWPALREITTWTRDGETRLDVVLDGRQVGSDAAPLATRRRLLGSGAAATVIAARFDDDPRLLVALRGGDARTRGTFARDVLRPALLREPAIERVTVLGAGRARVAVTPLAAELLARNLAPSDVAAAVCGLGVEEAAGTLLDGAATRGVVVRDRVRSLTELGARRVATAFLADVAQLAVEQASDGARVSIAGEPGVLLALSGDGAARAARRVLARLAPPPGVAVETRAVTAVASVAFDDATPGVAEAAELRAHAAAGEAAWSLWREPVADAAPDDAEATDPGPDGAPGRLWIPTRRDTKALAGALAAQGLRLVPPQRSTLWLEGVDPGAIEAAATAAAAVMARLGITDVPRRAPEARRVVRLRPELDAETRRSVQGDLLAAAGRAACGHVEIAGVDGAVHLRPTLAPQPELLPVRLGARVVPVATAAAAIARAPAPLLVRHDGRAARCYRFARAADARRVAAALGPQPGVRVRAVAAAGEGAGRFLGGLAAALALALAAIAPARSPRRASDAGARATRDA